MDESNKSRRAFLGAGLVVGGALYADPASALAMTGGRPIVNGQPVVLPNASSKKTQIQQYVGELPDNAGTLTLGDLSAISDLNDKVIQKIGKDYLSVTYADLAEILSITSQKSGSQQNVFMIGSGGRFVVPRCCCCCCCFQ